MARFRCKPIWHRVQLPVPTLLFINMTQATAESFGCKEIRGAHVEHMDDVEQINARIQFHGR